MEEKGIKELVQALYKDIKKYLKLQIDYQRLNIIETIVVFITKVFSFAIIWILVFVVGFFMVMALALFLGDLLGAYYLGFLIAAGVVALFGLIIYMLRKSIFTNPITNALVTAAFSNQKLKSKKKNEPKKI